MRDMSTHAPTRYVAPFADGSRPADTLGRMLLEAFDRNSGPAMRFRSGDAWV